MAAPTAKFQFAVFFFSLLVSRQKKEFRFKGNNKPHVYAESFAVFKSVREENWKQLWIEGKTAILTGAQGLWYSCGV